MTRKKQRETALVVQFAQKVENLQKTEWTNKTLLGFRSSAILKQETVKCSADDKESCIPLH